MGCKGEDSPIVPRPPNRQTPNRANGRLMVTILGVTERMTIVDDGSVGKSGAIVGSRAQVFWFFLWFFCWVT